MAKFVTCLSTVPPCRILQCVSKAPHALEVISSLARSAIEARASPLNPSVADPCCSCCRECSFEEAWQHPRG